MAVPFSERGCALSLLQVFMVNYGVVQRTWELGEQNPYKKDPENIFNGTMVIVVRQCAEV